MPPAEAHLVLTNISDLFSGILVNQSSTPLNSTDLRGVLRDTAQTIDTQIPAAVTTDSVSQNIFYGVSHAAPGTFQIIIQR